MKNTKIKIWLYIIRILLGIVLLIFDIVTSNTIGIILISLLIACDIVQLVSIIIQR